jgi:hypothetical protein
MSMTLKKLVFTEGVLLYACDSEITLPEKAVIIGYHEHETGRDRPRKLQNNRLRYGN